MIVSFTAEQEEKFAKAFAKQLKEMRERGDQGVEAFVEWLKKNNNGKPYPALNGASIRSWAGAKEAGGNEYTLGQLIRKLKDEKLLSQSQYYLQTRDKQIADFFPKWDSMFFHNGNTTNHTPGQAQDFLDAFNSVLDGMRGEGNQSVDELVAWMKKKFGKPYPNLTPENIAAWSGKKNWSIGDLIRELRDLKELDDTRIFNNRLLQQQIGQLFSRSTLYGAARTTKDSVISVGKIVKTSTLYGIIGLPIGAGITAGALFAYNALPERVQEFAKYVIYNPQMLIGGNQAFFKAFDSFGGFVSESKEKTFQSNEASLVEWQAIDASLLRTLTEVMKQAKTAKLVPPVPVPLQNGKGPLVISGPISPELMASNLFNTYKGYQDAWNTQYEKSVLKLKSAIGLATDARNALQKFDLIHPKKELEGSAVFKAERVALEAELSKKLQNAEIFREEVLFNLANYKITLTLAIAAAEVTPYTDQLKQSLDLQMKTIDEEIKKTIPEGNFARFTKHYITALDIMREEFDKFPRGIMR